MLGTRGVPPRYGGFETAVHEVGQRLVNVGHSVVVYTRDPGVPTRLFRPTNVSVDGINALHLPAVRSKHLETLTHTFFSAAHAVRSRPDVAFIFNAANAPVLPILKAARIPYAVHIDGLEWRRSKWGRLGQTYYKRAERFAVFSSEAIVSDARGIQHYVREQYGAESDYIPYGAPLIESSPSRLHELGLDSRRYHLVVARFEPENHVREIVKWYASSGASHPLIVVGDAPYADTYKRSIEAASLGDQRVRLLGGIWDDDLLNALYGQCLSYIHGHSVGGTNPSLLRAMGAGAAVTAFDVNFNREVTGGESMFFSDRRSLVAALERDEREPEMAAERGQRGKAWVAHTYDWDDVASKYEALATRLTRL